MLFAKINDQCNLILLQEHHAEELFDTYIKNKQFLVPWMPWAKGSTKVEHTRKFIQVGLKKFGESAGMELGVQCKGQIVGTLGLPRVDRVHKCAELGYWLDSDHQGKGLMALCCQAVIDHLFSKDEFNRIQICCAVENEKSQGIPRRLGFKEEGTLRQTLKVNDQFQDMIIFSLLRSDWEEKIKK